MRSVRAVLYLRMSTDKQETSIADQRKELTAHAKARSYSIVGEYVDEGISGDATEKRLAFQRMVADSGKKRFELILCWDQDRFGRFDPLEGGYWIKPIRDAGVQLETIAQGRIDWSDFASRLVWTITQEAKHAYLRTMAKDVVRGLRSAVESGVYPGMAPYGYRKQNKRLVLGPDDEVQTVRDIFAMKIGGMGHRTICARLHQEGRPTYAGGEWTQGQVRYILDRVAYTGITYYGRVPQGKYSRQSAPIIVEGTHPAIISRETFDAAKNSRKPSTVSYRHGRMVGALAGLMRCGMCGSLLYRHKCGNRYGYICGRYHRKNGCGCCRIQEDDALRIISERIRLAVGSCETALAKKIEQQQRLRPRKDVSRLAKRVDEITHQLERAAERLVSVDDDLVPAVKRKLSDLRIERDAAQAQLRAAQPEELVSPTVIAKRLVQLPALILSRPPDLVRKLLEASVSNIVVHFEQEERTCTRRFFRMKSIELTFRS